MAGTSPTTRNQIAFIGHQEVVTPAVESANPHAYIEYAFNWGLICIVDMYDAAPPPLTPRGFQDAAPPTRAIYVESSQKQRQPAQQQQRRAQSPGQTLPTMSSYATQSTKELPTLTADSLAKNDEQHHEHMQEHHKQMMDQHKQAKIALESARIKKELQKAKDEDEAAASFKNGSQISQERHAVAKSGYLAAQASQSSQTDAGQLKLFAAGYEPSQPKTTGPHRDYAFQFDANDQTRTAFVGVTFAQVPPTPGNTVVSRICDDPVSGAEMLEERLVMLGVEELNEMIMAANTRAELAAACNGKGLAEKVKESKGMAAASAAWASAAGAGEGKGEGSELGSKAVAKESTGTGAVTTQDSLGRETDEDKCKSENGYTEEMTSDSAPCTSQPASQDPASQCQGAAPGAPAANGSGKSAEGNDKSAPMQLPLSQDVDEASMHCLAVLDYDTTPTGAM